MAATATFTRPKSKALFRAQDATTESWAVRGLLISTAVLFLGIFLFLPLVVVFTTAFARGVSLCLPSLREPDALAAIRLTLLTAAIAVPLNLVFGVAAAWSIGKFEFLGKSLLVTLIDLPFSVSPVVAGLIYVLCFGLNGLLGPSLAGDTTAIIFVTFPFVAREMIPFFQAQGNEEEEAALTLGANGWQTLFRVTLPNAKW